MRPFDANARSEFAARLASARQRTDELFALLNDRALLERPIPERNRLIFYLGHLEAFDWNLLCRDAAGAPSRHATFEKLFAFGIDPLDGTEPVDTAADWPARAEIDTWNRAVRADVDDLVARAPFDGWLEQGWAFNIAIEHRLMHAETLCYLFQRLEPKHLRAIEQRALAPTPLVERPKTVSVPAGPATLGLARATHGFVGWDNEYEQHTVQAAAFELDTLPVSNAAWLAFIEAGGYANRALWAEHDWAWKERTGLTHPGFWRRDDAGWKWRAFFSEVPLPLDWPVYVSHAEASAYAKWQGARLPTEVEWHRAVGARPAIGNANAERFDPLPSGAHPGGVSESGAVDLFGNGWEWTSTVFAPFAGFAALPFYKGYSADFFDGRHYVMKGASARTEGSLLRSSFRNWFQTQYPAVPAKFRLVR